MPRAILACALIASAVSFLPDVLGTVNLVRAKDSRVLEKTCTVEAPRSEVWKAFTTSAGAATFFAPAAHIDLRLGGRYELWFVPSAPKGSRGSEGCRVLSFIPEEMLSFTWNAPPQFKELRADRTFVVLHFTDAGEGRTSVRLTHAGWPEGAAWDEVMAYFDRAWSGVLSNLQKRFTEGPRFPVRPGDEAPASRPRAKHWVYFLRPARSSVLAQPTEEETKAFSGHVAYVKSLLASGRLVAAGPAMDPAQYPEGGAAVALEIVAPGIVIFEADDEDEARQVMEADPAVRAGVFKSQVNPFALAFFRR